MKGLNAITEEYESVEVFEKPALFTNNRIGHSTVPANLYCYDMRGSDCDPGMLKYVERNVRVNHSGTVISAVPLLKDKQEYKWLQGRINFLGNLTSIGAFCATKS